MKWNRQLRWCCCSDNDGILWGVLITGFISLLLESFLSQKELSLFLKPFVFGLPGAAEGAKGTPTDEYFGSYLCSLAIAANVDFSVKNVQAQIQRCSALVFLQCFPKHDYTLSESVRLHGIRKVELCLSVNCMNCWSVLIYLFMEPDRCPAGWVPACLERRNRKSFVLGSFCMRKVFPTSLRAVAV